MGSLLRCVALTGILLRPALGVVGWLAGAFIGCVNRRYRDDGKEGGCTAPRRPRGP